MTGKYGEIRIIAGKWRGRKLSVLQDQAIRPTPDRVRETVFNWLQPFLPGAKCLDLFAGSGALAFEALSRGAKFVQLVDSSPVILQHLKTAYQTLALKEDDKHSALFVQHKWPGILSSNTRFDVVFIDPPYQSQLWMPCVQQLEEHQMLESEAYIYLEAGLPIMDNALPQHWEMLKRKQAGQVFYHLAKRRAVA